MSTADAAVRQKIEANIRQQVLAKLGRSTAEVPAAATTTRG